MIEPSLSGYLLVQVVSVRNDTSLLARSAAQHSDFVHCLGAFLFAPPPQSSNQRVGGERRGQGKNLGRDEFFHATPHPSARLPLPHSHVVYCIRLDARV